MSNLNSVINIEDLRRLAHRRLPDFVIGPVERGAGNGDGNRRNVDAFRSYPLSPRHMVGVSPVDTRISLFGREYASPFGISAVGGLGFYWRNADQLLARLAKVANIPFILSGAGTASIEQIAPIAPDNVWYQLYASGDTRITDDLIGRALAVGVRTLVITVDFPIQPRNEAIERSGVTLASKVPLRKWPGVLAQAMLHPHWSIEYLRGERRRAESWVPYAPPGSDAQGIVRFFRTYGLGNHTWSEVARVRKLWPGTLVVKGIASAHDALQAVRAGADAVTVSNHGGNRLDCLPPSVELLPEVASAVDSIAKGRVAVLFDGGIRRGSDLIVARALGAAACFAGRSVLYGVAAAGYDGAERAVSILQSELTYAMSMVGAKAWTSITGEFLHQGPRSPAGSQTRRPAFEPVQQI